MAVEKAFRNCSVIEFINGSYFIELMGFVVIRTNFRDTTTTAIKPTKDLYFTGSTLALGSLYLHSSF